MSAHAQRVERIIQRELADRETYRGGAGPDLRRLWRDYLGDFRGYFVGAIIFAFLQVAANFLFPLTHRYLIDEALNATGVVPPGKFDYHLRLVGLVFGMNCGIWLTIVVSEWLTNRLIVASGQGLVFALRRDLHDKVQRLHVGFFERTPSGKLLSRILDDVNVIRRWSTMQLVNLFRTVVQVFLGLGLMFWLHAGLALAVLASLPFYAAAFAVLRPRIRRAHITLRRLNSNMYALASERVRGIRLVKAFFRERSERRRFARLVLDHARVGVRQIFYNQFLSLVAVAISGTATFAVIYYGFSLTRSGEISLGTIVAFVSLVWRVFEPVRMIAMMATRIQAVLVVIRRVFRLLDEPEEVPPGRIQLAGMKGKIVFDHVTFRYPGQTGNALEDVRFRIQPGEKIALMGPSGAGKSTVFNLLLRFYDPDEGAVRVGGVNVADADPASLREHVRMVQQEPTVFSGTVADNIAYGHLRARPSAIMNAARASELHDFVMSLPVKYETTVGEGGVTLSGGQKQRLALATALLTDPEVLLLDDTTSALDSRTEARIRATLNRVLAGRTSIIITQRVATARDCDRIIVLENGRITQEGSHAELADQEGFYARICEQQEIG